jgi:hypothetical protein
MWAENRMGRGYVKAEVEVEVKCQTEQGIEERNPPSLKEDADSSACL